MKPGCVAGGCARSLDNVVLDVNYINEEPRWRKQLHQVLGDIEVFSGGAVKNICVVTCSTNMCKKQLRVGRQIFEIQIGSTGLYWGRQIKASVWEIYGMPRSIGRDRKGYRMCLPVVGNEGWENLRKLVWNTQLGVRGWWMVQHWAVLQYRRKINVLHKTPISSPFKRSLGKADILH